MGSLRSSDGLYLMRSLIQGGAAEFEKGTLAIHGEDKTKTFLTYLSSATGFRPPVVV